MPSRCTVSSSFDSRRVVRNSLLTTTMSIFERYLVKSEYLCKIVPTSAFTDIPIRSASSSSVLKISGLRRKDLVTVDLDSITVGDKPLRSNYNDISIKGNSCILYKTVM